MSNLPVSNWTKKAMDSFTDIMLVIDKIKKHRTIPENISNSVVELKQMLTIIETDIVKRELFRTKMALTLRDVYALVKDSNLLTKKEKKEFRKGCNEFVYASPTGVQVNHSYNQPRQIGFGQNFGRATEQPHTYASTPMFRSQFEVKQSLTSIYKGGSTFSRVPDIIMSRLAFNKLKVWCESLDDEIQAMGIVEMQEGGEFFIKDFFLFDQIVSKTTCEEKNAQALVDLMMHVESKGYNSRDLKVWWHSHNSMGVTPSAQDLRTTEKFGASGFLISLISNHAGQFNSKISFTKPFEFEILNVPIMVADEGLSPAFITEQQDLIKKHVETRRTNYYHSGPSHYTPNRHDNEPVWSRNRDSDVVNKPEPLIDDYLGHSQISEMFHKQDNLDDASHEKDESKEFDEMFDDANICSAVEQGEPPFEANFSEGPICYNWNSVKRRYDMQDEMGKILTAKDLEQLGACDYNQIIDKAIEAMRNGVGVIQTREGA